MLVECASATTGTPAIETQFIQREELQHYHSQSPQSQTYRIRRVEEYKSLDPPPIQNAVNLAVQ